MEGKRKMLLLKRLVAAGIDMFVAVCIITPPVIVMELDKWIFICLGVILIWLKDLSGRSLGKRLLNLKLLDVHSQKKIVLMNRIFRNIFIVLWPVEVFLLLTKGKRIGDILFCTQVAEA